MLYSTLYPILNTMWMEHMATFNQFSNITIFLVLVKAYHTFFVFVFCKIFIVFALFSILKYFTHFLSLIFAFSFQLDWFQFEFEVDLVHYRCLGTYKKTKTLLFSLWALSKFINCSVLFWFDLRLLGTFGLWVGPRGLNISLLE